MADYGLKCWDAGGNLTLDLTDTISRLRYSVEVAAGNSDNVVLSDINGKNTVEFAVAKETNKVPPIVTRSGTTITWVARTGDAYILPSASLILVFIFD